MHYPYRNKLDSEFRQRMQGFSACKLGATIIEQLRLGTYYLLLRILGKLKRHTFSHPANVSIRYKDTTFKYKIASIDDYRILEEIFCDEQYKLKIDDALIRTIVDLGSNIGMSVQYFLLNHPQAHIYAFEPVRYCFDRLVEVVGENERVTSEQKAIAVTSDQLATLYIHPTCHSGSSNFEITGAKLQQVPTINLDSIIKKYNIESIDILKIDIEGLEYQIFSEIRDLERVKYIFAEVHPGMSGHSVDEFLRLCPGFSLMEVLENPYTSKAVTVKLANKNI